MGDDLNPTTQELRLEQDAKAHAEAAHAEEAQLDAEQHAAERRADKAAYLRDKLAEQAAADEGER